MNFNIQTIIAVGIGGFIGSILRFYINTVVSSKFPHDIPLATLGVNIVGSFFIGVLMAVFINNNPSELLKGFLTIGLLGALTTYSTFAIETYFLLNTSLYYAILNMTLNLFGTIIFAAIGYKMINLALN